jgi:sugar/nucleoside kinase (ribokinase family)
MPDPRLDVLCIGNAIVDVIANASDDFLADEGLVKGSMRLIDAEEAERLYSHMGPAHQVSGGSAGNTAAGVAALGGRAGFIGQVAPDQLGDFYRHDLTAAGVEFITPAAEVGAPTARSMILVTPDGHRTMNTFLGAAQHLPRSALDEQQIESSSILYLEGYLWDPETPRYAMVRAIEVARLAGRKVAFDGRVDEARAKLRPIVRLRTRASDGPWRSAIPAGARREGDEYVFELPEGGPEPLLKALIDGGAGIETLAIERPGLHDAFVSIAGNAAAAEMGKEKAE